MRIKARNEAQEERKRELLSAGLLAERFPSVFNIVVRMNYRGGRTSSLRRTVNFLPGSPAFFRITCLGEGCERGGLDLSWVIGSMIRRGQRSAKGELKCLNQDSGVLHADVDYDVEITYDESRREASS